MTETRFNAAVKSAASAVCAIFALVAHVMGWSPVFVSQNFLDLIATAICSLGAVYWALKHGDE